MLVSKYILSVCQCVVGDLFKKKIFDYVSDSVVFNDYHDLRNNCSCKSGKLHSFRYLYCHKHDEILTKCFSYDVCENASRFCGNRSTAACNECFDYYKFYCLTDAIKICISSLTVKGKRYSRYIELFAYIDAHNFSQTCRKIKHNVTE